MNEWKQICPHFDALCLHFPIPLSDCPVTSALLTASSIRIGGFTSKNRNAVWCAAYSCFETSCQICCHIVLSVTHTWSKNDSNACSWMEIMSRLATYNIIHLKDFALYRSFCHSLSTHPLEWRNSATCLSTQLRWMLTGISTHFVVFQPRISEGSPHSTIKHVNTFHTFHTFLHFIHSIPHPRKHPHIHRVQDVMAGAIHEKRYATQLKTNKETSWISSTPQKINKIHTPKTFHYTIHLDVSESISLENDMEINMLEGNLHVHRFPRLDRFWKHSSVKLEKCQSNCSGWKLPYQFSSRVSKQFSGH